MNLQLGVSLPSHWVRVSPVGCGERACAASSFFFELPDSLSACEKQSSRHAISIAPAKQILKFAGGASSVGVGAPAASRSELLDSMYSFTRTRLLQPQLQNRNRSTVQRTLTGNQTRKACTRRRQTSKTQRIRFDRTLSSRCRHLSSFFCSCCGNENLFSLRDPVSKGKHERNKREKTMG